DPAAARRTGVVRPKGRIRRARDVAARERSCSEPRLTARARPPTPDHHSTCALLRRAPPLPPHCEPDVPVLLFSHLLAGRVDREDLAGLHALARAPVGERAPWLGVIGPALAHDDEE